MLYSKGTIKTLAGFYSEYLDKNPKGSSSYLTSKQYRDILELHFQLSMHHLITSGNPFKMVGMGFISIKKVRPTYDNQKKIDWKRSKESGTTIYHSNNHSNGYYGRIRWEKSKTYLHNKHVFKFTACRWATRLMKTYIIEHNSIVKYYG